MRESRAEEAVLADEGTGRDRDAATRRPQVARKAVCVEVLAPRDRDVTGDVEAVEVAAAVVEGEAAEGGAPFVRDLEDGAQGCGQGAVVVPLLPRAGVGDGGGHAGDTHAAAHEAVQRWPGRDLVAGVVERDRAQRARRPAASMKVLPWPAPLKVPLKFCTKIVFV